VVINIKTGDGGLLMQVFLASAFPAIFLTNDFMRVKYTHRKCAGGFYASDI